MFIIIPVTFPDKFRNKYSVPVVITCFCVRYPPNRRSKRTGMLDKRADRDINSAAVFSRFSAAQKIYLAKSEHFWYYISLWVFA